ncbi:Uncharacterised protein [Mycobacterium tuberculosis]|nr:Uncharacterised protein [Mycobacterium tuberculosis]
MRSDSGSASTARSATRTVAPATSASALIAAPPASMLATIWAVTSGGYADTPDRATPWSPANTTTRARSNCRGGQRCWHDATQTDRSSRLPSAPRGLVKLSCRARAAASAAASGVDTGAKPIILSPA